MDNSRLKKEDYFHVTGHSDFSLALASRGSTGSLYISTDAREWKHWDGSKRNYSVQADGEVTVYLRAENNTGGMFGRFSLNQKNTEGDLEIGGNIETLLDYHAVEDGRTIEMPKDCFMRTFMSSSVRDASGLVLPTVHLAERCYAMMFANCSSLRTAPKLPAVHMAKRSCFAMFACCNNLQIVPELAPEKLADECCMGMFAQCFSLRDAPKLPAAECAYRCYGEMFYGCRKLEYLPVLPAMTLAEECYKGMFRGCCSVYEPPELPALDLKKGCYKEMFWDCRSLKSFPELPATTLAKDCYDMMFCGCVEAEGAPVLPSEPETGYGCYGMFSDCRKMMVSPSLLKIATSQLPGTGDMLGGCFRPLPAASPDAPDKAGLWLPKPEYSGTFDELLKIVYRREDVYFPVAYKISTAGCSEEELKLIFLNLFSDVIYSCEERDRRRGDFVIHEGYALRKPDNYENSFLEWRDLYWTKLN